MRKSIIDHASQTTLYVQEGWLDIASFAQVEVTSEQSGYPVDSALVNSNGPGWRASLPGPQTIRLLFDQPQQIRRIHLIFHEAEQERTQEFILRWLRNGEQTFREILRQQYTFCPPETVKEEENYAVELDGIVALEFRVIPDVAGGKSLAQLTQLRLA